MRRRTAGADPSHSSSANERRAGKMSKSRKDAAEWRRVNGPEPDPDEFRRKILPRLLGLPARRLAEATGLSRPYCDSILRGVKVPHPRWWALLAECAPTP